MARSNLDVRAPTSPIRVVVSILYCQLSKLVVCRLIVTWQDGGRGRRGCFSDLMVRVRKFNKDHPLLNVWMKFFFTRYRIFGLFGVYCMVVLCSLPLSARQALSRERESRLTVGLLYPRMGLRETPSVKIGLFNPEFGTKAGQTL